MTLGGWVNNPGEELCARHKKQKVQRHRGMKMPVMPEEQPTQPEHSAGKKTRFDWLVPVSLQEVAECCGKERL